MPKANSGKGKEKQGKEQKDLEDKKNQRKWTVGVILFAIAVTAATCYLFWDASRTHEMVCSVKVVDQPTGLVLMDCAR